MGSAIATAALGARLLRARRAVCPLTREPISWRVVRPARRHWIGGALFGVGWGITCMCPGPISIQVARGELPGIIVAAGVLIGIAACEAFAGARGSARIPAVATEPAHELI
jgi:uncharacterized membrane protein YedE/YeeE